MGFETLQRVADIAGACRCRHRPGNHWAPAQHRDYRDTAARLGIDPATVDNTLYDAFGQRHVAQIFTTLNYYFVIMEVGPQFQLGSYALNRIYVGSSTGAQVPLAQFVKIV